MGPSLVDPAARRLAVGAPPDQPAATDSMGIASNPHGTSKRAVTGKPACVAGQGSNGSPIDNGVKGAVDMMPVAVAVLVGRFFPGVQEPRRDE
jgi:hypothetical protein